MEAIQLHIKNMVCPRCILVVKNELTALWIEVLQVDLGRATIFSPKSLTWNQIDKKLRVFGFELLHDQELITIEQIKLTIVFAIETNNGIKGILIEQEQPGCFEAKFHTTKT